MKTLEEVLEQVEYLNLDGIDEKYMSYNIRKTTQVMQLDEETIAQFEKAGAWIGDTLWSIKSINHEHTHVQLAALYAKDNEAIPLGLFIAAMVAVGYKFHKHPHTPNVYFNVSKMAVSRRKKKLHDSYLEKPYHDPPLDQR